MQSETGQTHGGEEQDAMNRARRSTEKLTALEKQLPKIQNCDDKAPAALESELILSLQEVHESITEKRFF